MWCVSGGLVTHSPKDPLPKARVRSRKLSQFTRIFLSLLPDNAQILDLGSHPQQARTSDPQARSR